MIEVLFYKMHLTCARYKMQQDKNFPVSPAKVWKVAKHVLVNQVRGFEQGSRTKVHLIILCPDSAGHPSRDGVLLIVGVQVFRLGLSIYPSLTPGGHNHSYLL